MERRETDKPMEERFAHELLADFSVRGDQPAFEELVRRHGPMVLNVCFKILQNRADAEDATQAVFMLLAQKAGRLTRPMPLAPWLHHVAVCVSRNLWNSEKARAMRNQRAAARPPDVPDEDAVQQMKERLDEEIDRLPERFRAPIVLHYYEGKKLNEIAKTLRCPISTVGDRLQRARSRLQSRLSRAMPVTSIALAAALSALSRDCMALTTDLTQSILASSLGALSGAAGAGGVAAVSKAAILAHQTAKALWLEGARTWIAAALAVIGVGGAATIAVSRLSPPDPNTLSIEETAARGADRPADRFALARSGSAETDAIAPNAPWRVYLTQGPPLSRADGRPNAVRIDNSPTSPLPPPGWARPDFADAQWGRYGEDLDDHLGGYGNEIEGARAWPLLLCLRTRFGVEDPARAQGLTLHLLYLGGAVVFVNGAEVARSHLPPGPIDPLTSAEAYPLEAYVMADGKRPLPRPEKSEALHYTDRYELRVRSLDARIPRETLVRGTNVLAIELHAAPISVSLGDRGWSHLGVRAIRLTNADRGGAIPYGKAAAGPRVWNAAPMETVADRPARKIPAESSVYASSRAIPVKGLVAGNPFDPLNSLRIAAARNGTFAGQVVLTDPGGLRDVSAVLGPLTRIDSADGAAIPAQAVQIRYAVQHEGAEFCDRLAPAPASGARTQPVWILLRVPKEQAPGWYAGSLTLSANGRTFQAPVQVLVDGFALPDPRQFRSLVGLIHSPDTVALKYGVEPWSDRHFQLMEKTLDLLGQLGNDVVHVPIILDTHVGCRTGMIRFVAAGDGVKPDFSALERYLDLYVKHGPPPQVLSLILWEPRFAVDVTETYQTEPRLTTGLKARPLRVTAYDPKTGAMTEMAAPRVGETGGEAFWRPVLDGVREIVTRRGWSERIIMLGQAFDWRPAPAEVELLRRWAPYARWSVFSRFSRESPPGPDGRFIAGGGLEVGYKEIPSTVPLPAMFPENAELRKFQFLQAGSHRLAIHQKSTPDAYRSVAWITGTLCRLGMDFWPVPGKDGKASVTLFNARDWFRSGEWRVYTNIPLQIAAAGPEGAEPTVRFQMLREAVQEAEAWIAIRQAIAKLPAQGREPYLRLWNEAKAAYEFGGRLPLARSLDEWQGLAARVYAAAGELTGSPADARWDRPPR